MLTHLPELWQQAKHRSFAWLDAMLTPFAQFDRCEG